VTIFLLCLSTWLRVQFEHSSRCGLAGSGNPEIKFAEGHYEDCYPDGSSQSESENVSLQIPTMKRTKVCVPTLKKKKFPTRLSSTVVGEMYFLVLANRKDPIIKGIVQHVIKVLKYYTKAREMLKGTSLVSSINAVAKNNNKQHYYSTLCCNNVIR